MDTAPRAFRPKFALTYAVGLLLYDLHDGVYALTEADFVNRLMSATGGMLKPSAISQVYRDLMEEAGLVPVTRTPSRP